LHRSYLDQIMEKQMNGFKSVTKTLTWSMALLLAAFVAGCSGDGSSTSTADGLRTNISGINAADVAGVVTGGGFIKVVNNGAHVAATQNGTGTIDIVNNGQVLTATNTGSGRMAITSNATGAVTVTRTGNGNTTVNATGAGAIALAYTDDADHTYP
jgi:hypothetical protein